MGQGVTFFRGRDLLQQQWGPLAIHSVEDEFLCWAAEGGKQGQVRAQAALPTSAGTGAVQVHTAAVIQPWPQGLGWKGIQPPGMGESDTEGVQGELPGEKHQFLISHPSSNLAPSAVPKIKNLPPKLQEYQELEVKSS